MRSGEAVETNDTDCCCIQGITAACMRLWRNTGSCECQIAKIQVSKKTEASKLASEVVKTGNMINVGSCRQVRHGPVRASAIQEYP